MQLNKKKPFDSVVDVERAGTLAEVAASQEGSQKSIREGPEAYTLKSKTKCIMVRLKHGYVPQGDIAAH